MSFTDIVSSKLFIAVVSGVVGAAAGGSGVYFFLKTKLEKQYEEQIDAEILATKKYYSTLYKEGYSDPVTLAKGITVTEGYISEDEDSADVEDESVVLAPPSNTEKKKRVVETPEEEEYVIDDELDKRRANLPWIIEEEYFIENPDDCSQTSLTYYELDDVLVDENDVPIDDWFKFLGNDNFKFGTGSHDHNVVYIQNDELDAQYEVVRSFKSYAEDVLGFSHYDDNKPRKFRSYH